MKKQNQKPSSNFKSPPSSNKLSPSSSAANRKTRWESNNPPSSEKKQPDSNPKSSSSSKPSENPTPSAPAFSTPTAASVGPLPPLPPPGPTAGPAFALPDMGPPLPPAYGFHNLERRTIVLADGSVRSYFALPPDEFPPSRSPADLAVGPRDFRGPPESSLKRKYVEEEIERDRQRQHLHQYGNLNPNPNGYPSGPAGDYRSGSGYFGGGPSSPYRLGMVDDPRPSKHVKVGGGGDFYGELPRRGVSDEEIRPKHLDVDPQALKRSFLRFAKLLNEGASQRKNFLEDGKSGPLPCLACGRASKEYEDVHGLVMHAYNSSNGDSWVEHLGFHKALCILMGWNFSRVPDNSKAYQSLPADDAAANREDLIIWPPTIIVHNTNLGRKNGRMEGLGNKDMDNKLRDLGFAGGKSKSMYGKDGHMGVSVVKFANNQAGLKEAERLAEYFEMGHHGRKGWARAQASQRPDEDDEQNPHLFKIDEKTREKKRILYGYLGTVSDLDKVDFDMKKKAVIKSRRELDVSD